MGNAASQAVQQTVFGLIVNHGKGSYFGGYNMLPACLSREIENEALRRMSENDSNARDMLIEHNLRLVAFFARKYENTCLDIDDLISVGAIGLIKAVDTFNIERNIRLATYAARCIENEILMALRRTERLRKEVSFDRVFNYNGDGDGLPLSNLIGTDSDLISHDLDANVERQMLYRAIQSLSGFKKQILALRYGLDDGCERTQREVADTMGFSQSYISKLERGIIKQLRIQMMKQLSH